MNSVELDFRYLVIVKNMAMVQNMCTKLCETCVDQNYKFIQISPVKSFDRSAKRGSESSLISLLGLTIHLHSCSEDLQKNKTQFHTILQNINYLILNIYLIFNIKSHM